MKVSVVNSLRWRVGMRIKEWGERTGNNPLATLGKRIAWGAE